MISQREITLMVARASERGIVWKLQRLVRQHFNLRSVGLVAVTLFGTYAVVKSGIFVWRYAVIGPYPSVHTTNPFALINRILVDRSRVNFSMNWYPTNSITNTRPRRATENGHGICGAVRDAARLAIENAVMELGLRVVEISPAARNNPDAAIHQHYAVGDLHRDIQSADLSGGSVLMCIDVDYYARNPTILLGHNAPVVLHTFNPVHVSGMDGDTPFTITNNVVDFAVSGGGAWKHRVWDWTISGEFLKTEMSTNWWKAILSLFGVRKYITHKVHHSRPWDDCPDRAMVWLLPQYTYWSIAWLPSDLNVRTLQYVEYADKLHAGWNRLNSIGIDGDANALAVSIGREGETTSIRVRRDVFETIMALKSSQSVTSRLLSLKVNDPVVRAMLNAYHEGRESILPEAPLITKSSAVKVHWPHAAEMEMPEISYRAYSSPLVSDCNMVPQIKRWEAASQTIDQRVTFVANNKVPSDMIRNYANEFVKIIVPVAGIGAPYSLESTKELLDKPGQILAVRAIWDTLDIEARRLIEAFMKNEPTMKAGRLISSFPDARFLLQFSSFTLAFRDRVLHSEENKHWFCPGKTPIELSNAVCDYVRSVEGVIEGDYSNFDGSVSNWAMRYVMNAVYHRYFNVEYHKQLKQYTSAIITSPARMKRFCFSYDAGVGVKSGSPTTCDLNSVLNGFVMYAAVRKTDPTMTPIEAFQHIGLAFGDDSLFNKRYQKNFNRIADDIGLKLKVEVCTRETGVNFLARVFPDPYTTNTSFQDPLRTWRKLHLTSRDPNVPIDDAALDRLDGYRTTDPLTPVTSNYVNMMTRLCDDHERRFERRDHDREKSYWLFSSNTWPQREEDIPLMQRVIACRTGLSEEQLTSICAFLDVCTDRWSPDITINRDESELPYQNTILPCGAIAEGDVDQRNYEYGAEQIRLRADQNTSTAGARTAEQRDRSTSNDRDSGRGSGQRSPELRKMPRRYHQQTRKRDEQPAIKSTRRRSVGRTGSGNDSVDTGRKASPAVRTDRGITRTNGQRRDLDRPSTSGIVSHPHRRTIDQ